jgi:putative transposase
MADRVVPVDVRAVIVQWPDQAPRGEVSRFIAASGISRSQFYEIRKRAREEGAVAAMSPRPRELRTPRHPQAMPAAVEDLAVEIRKDLAGQGLDHGPVTVRWHLQQLGVPAPATSTLARMFTRRGMVVPQPQKRPRSSYRRFEFAAVHECWQLDAFEWPLADGTISCVYQILDDHSRFLIASHVATSENVTDAITVLDNALVAAGQVPCLFLSDNGTAFNQDRRGRTTRLVAQLRALGVKPITGRPYRPQTQGKNERIHQTTQRWLTAHEVPTDLAHLQRLLGAFEETYNHHRPHQALSMRTPSHALTHDTRAIPPTPPEPATTTDRAARVTGRQYLLTKDGELNIRRRIIALGREHARESVIAIDTGHRIDIFDHTGTHLRTRRPHTRQDLLRQRQEITRWTQTTPTVHTYLRHQHCPDEPET